MATESRRVFGVTVTRSVVFQGGQRLRGYSLFPWAQMKHNLEASVSAVAHGRLQHAAALVHVGCPVTPVLLLYKGSGRRSALVNHE